MRNSKIVFMMAIFFIGISSIMAQSPQMKTNNKTEALKENVPQATVSYKIILKPNQLIEQVNILTNGDEILTEKTIFQIRKTKNSHIQRVVSDKEFYTLSKEMQLEAIKESEVIAIINQLKK